MPDYLFVTGKLAAPALAATLEAMKPAFSHMTAVLGASVAALMDAGWISRHLPDAGGCRTVMIPGPCRGDLRLIEDRLGVPVVRGPNDLKDLPVHFGGRRDKTGYGAFRVRILAEIHDAHSLDLEAILARARYFRDSGADCIDLGGPPSGGLPQVETLVTALRAEGFAVSLDCFDPETIVRADRAGVDLVLSVNSDNLEVARGLRAKVVVIPDFGEGLASLEKNAARLAGWGIDPILDPILDPIGFGLSESLWRFREVRRRHPEAPMLMGLGNVTELTEADSTGVTAVLAGVMAELRIDYALTTEVASFARGAVRELDLARRIMHYAIETHSLPKGIDDALLTVKDPYHAVYSTAELLEIKERIRDQNYRIFVGNGRITVLNRDIFVQGTDPRELFPKLSVLDPGHAFYLGRELERAQLAVIIGKKYTQESPLRFGYLSPVREEPPQPSEPPKEPNVCA